MARGNNSDLIQMMLAAGATIGPAVNMGALMGTPAMIPKQVSGSSAPPAEKPKRASKWGNIKTEVDGITFDSRKEAARFSELVIMQKAGLISGLRLQVKMPLHVGDKLIGHIIPDFSYEEDGVEVFEDVKSKPTMTPIFRWKAKHFEAQYGKKIRVYQ